VRAEDLRTLDIPSAAKLALEQIGLPREVEPFFTTNIQETGILALGEYSRFTGTEMLSQGDELYRIGSDYGTEVCIRKGSGEVVSVDVQREYPTRFINTGLPQFIECLYVVSVERAEFVSLDDEEIDRRVLGIEREIARVDQRALQDDENWWAVIVEQMKDGLL